MPRSNPVKSGGYFIFLKTFAAFGLYGGIRRKIPINEAGHMTKMTAIPIYGKEFKNRLL